MRRILTMLNPYNSNMNPMNPKHQPLNASQFISFTKPKETLYNNGVVRKFGYVYDERMSAHKCDYDNTQIDHPDRTKVIYERLQADGLLTARAATDEELCLVHTKEFVRKIGLLKTQEECEEYCKDKELLWLNPESEKVARLAVGGVLELVKANVEQKVGNSFAIIRPQGHASWGDEPQGYCIYNNVAIAAKHAVQKLGLERVAVVDLDVHAPVGSYNALRDTVHGSKSKIVLFSVHSYHYGLFWPFTQDYDFDPKDGNVMFFPLNAPLNSEGEYMAIMNHAILPVLREFKPQLILVSAGFDSGYCDVMLDAGQALRAHGWGHIARDLHEIAPDRVIAVLEGGYHPSNISECASMMGKPTPRVFHPERLNGCLVETIFSVLLHSKERWRCLPKHIEKLQQQQAKNGFPEFTIPGQRLFLGHGLRDMWDDVKAAKACRTRHFVEPLTLEMAKIADRNIEDYKRMYIKNENEIVPEAFLIGQMLYDEKTKADSYLKASGIVQLLYNMIEDFKHGKYAPTAAPNFYRTKKMLICDRDTMLGKTGLIKYLGLQRI